MTRSQSIERIFQGELPEYVPFVLKGWRVPFCRAERKLRNDGMGVIDSAGVYAVRSPNVTTESHGYTENGIAYTRTTVRTPVGDLFSVTRRLGSEKTESTTWTVAPMYKRPEDYKVLRFIVEDQQPVPAYEGFLKAQQQMDGEAFFKTGAPGIALHTIMYSYLGIETFSLEWADRRDEILELNELMTEKQRRIYEIVADSPALVVQLGGNYSSEVLGRDRLKDFVLPHWAEACSILHDGGKLPGCHLDANNRLWAKEIGESDLDWIEAFTPAPDTDMTVADAREAWPGKTMFINYPSSVHLQPAEGIEKATKQILRDCAPGDRFIIGITENVPENRWRESFRTILDTCKEYGRAPIDPESF